MTTHTIAARITLITIAAGGLGLLVGCATPDVAADQTSLILALRAQAAGESDTPAGGICGDPAPTYESVWQERLDSIMRSPGGFGLGDGK